MIDYAKRLDELDKQIRVYLHDQSDGWGDGHKQVDEIIGIARALDKKNESLTNTIRGWSDEFADLYKYVFEVEEERDELFQKREWLLGACKAAETANCDCLTLFQIREAIGEPNAD